MAFRKQPNPLDRLRRPLIDPTIAILAVLFGLIAAAGSGTLIGIVLESVIASPFSGGCV
jgi:hypothetical protein